METPNNPVSQAPNNGGEMELDDHVFCPTHIFMISVNEKGENRYNKDSIEFKVEGDSNMGNLKITHMEDFEDYSEEQLQQARKLVENAIRRSILFPSGCSFSLRNHEDSSVEF